MRRALAQSHPACGDLGGPDLVSFFLGDRARPNHADSLAPCRASDDALGYDVVVPAKKATKWPVKPNPDRRVQVAVRLKPSSLATIDEFAREDQRTRSDMIRILLAEACAARERAKKLGR